MEPNLTAIILCTNEVDPPWIVACTGSKQGKLIIPPLPEGGGGYTFLPLFVCPSVRPSLLLSVLPSVQDIFRRIFLSNC